MSGLTYKLTPLLAGDSPEEVSDLFDFGAGQLPSVNPAIRVPLIWGEYLAGQNPEDPFRGRPIIPPTEFKAGFPHTMPPMLDWTWNETGAGNLVRWDPKANTTTELVLSAIPGLNRIIQSTDYGYREQRWALERADEQLRAEHRLAMPDNARSLLSEYFGLRGVSAERRTPSEMARYEALNVWYNSYYRGRRLRLAVDPQWHCGDGVMVCRFIHSILQKSVICFSSCF